MVLGLESVIRKMLLRVKGLEKGALKMNNRGIGFFGLLFIVLLVIKICIPTAISWFVVFLPPLVWLVLFILIVLLAASSPRRK